jgi:hypothetical protein
MADLKETVWEFVQGEKTGTIYSAQKRWINKIRKYAEQYPDEVQIIHTNSDGSIVAHALEGYFKFSRPRKIIFTEEQLLAAKERGKRLGNKNKQNN